MDAYIRPAGPNDVGRMAEIIVYNNRINYYPIFQDLVYSFSEYNVIDVAKLFLEDAEFMSNCYVYEDTVIRGFICIINREIKKLYVDSFFQGNGIGKALLQYAINVKKADNVWVLEKNRRAIAFYNQFDFVDERERAIEVGTTEYLVHLFR